MHGHKDSNKDLNLTNLTSDWDSSIFSTQYDCDFILYIR